MKSGRIVLRVIVTILLVAAFGALSVLAVMHYQANKNRTYSGAKYINVVYTDLL